LAWFLSEQSILQIIRIRINMKKIQLLAAFFLVALSVKAQTIQEGVTALENENFGKAREIFNKIITATPTSGDAYFYLGESYYLDVDFPGRSEKAKEYFTKGLTVDEKNAYCHVGLGKLFLDAGNTKESEKSFERAIKKARTKVYKEGHPDIFVLIGQAYAESSKPNLTEAINNFTRACDIEPKIARYWIKKGDGEIKKGNAGAAQTAYETAADKDKKNATVKYKMASIWSDAQKFELAIPLLNEGIQLDPNSAPNYKKLIEVYMRTKEYSKVTPLLEKYTQLAGTDLDARARYVRFLVIQAENYDKALEEALKLQKEMPDNVKLYRYIGWSLLKKKDPDCKGALENYKKLFNSVKAEDLYDVDYENYVKAAECEKDIDGATMAYRKLIANDTVNACTNYYKLLKFFYNNKKNKEFMDTYVEYVEKAKCKPSSNAVLYAIYSNYYYGNNIADVIKYSDQYIVLEPKEITGYNMKAKGLEKQDSGTPPQWLAKDAYEKVLDIGKTIFDDPKASSNTKSIAVDANLYLGNYYGSQNNLEMAKTYFNNVLKFDPTNKGVLDMLNQINGQGAPAPAPKN
jgi:tetratricopeptide (TPR) repeat protein